MLANSTNRHFETLKRAILKLAASRPGIPYESARMNHEFSSSTQALNLWGSRTVTICTYSAASERFRPFLGVQWQKETAVGSISQEYLLLYALDMVMTDDSDLDYFFGEKRSSPCYYTDDIYTPFQPTNSLSLPLYLSLSLFFPKTPAYISTRKQQLLTYHLPTILLIPLPFHKPRLVSGPAIDMEINMAVLNNKQLTN